MADDPTSARTDLRSRNSARSWSPTGASAVGPGVASSADRGAGADDRLRRRTPSPGSIFPARASSRRIPQVDDRAARPDRHAFGQGARRRDRRQDRYPGQHGRLHPSRRPRRRTAPTTARAGNGGQLFRPAAAGPGLRPGACARAAPTAQSARPPGSISCRSMRWPTFRRFGTFSASQGRAPIRCRNACAPRCALAACG